MKFRTFLCLLATLPCFAMRGAQTDQGIIIETADGGDLEIKLDTGVATYRNGVIVKYGLAILTADKVQINRLTGETFAEGNVILVREGGAVWRGERLAYNFKTRVIEGNEFKTGQPPYFAAGDHLITDPTNKTHTATNAFFTTDDHPEPGYRVRARKVIVVPGKSIEARHATLYLGDVPVFYFPYLHRSLDRHPNNFQFTPGYRTEWGAYLLNRYNWYWDDRLSGAINLDVRSRRGFGGGPDFYWERPDIGEGMLRYYYAFDNDPKEIAGFKDPPRDRQRVLFTHQATIRTNLTAKAVAAYQSDPFIVRDFFEPEYDDNVQPKSFLELNQAWRNWSVDLLTQPRVNDFQETVERLPDVKLTGLRQQLGPTPFFYESESSAGYFRHLFPVETNFFYPTNLPGYFGAARADTYHQLLLPWTFFGWLNVVPRVGQRFTYYSEAHERGGTTDEELRSVFNTGAEISFKASRVWRGVENQLLDVRDLRHIMEPTINYAFVPTPDDRPRELPQFDTELPTSRLLPIDFPDYNSIDSIDSQNVLRLGLRNKLQTKREVGPRDEERVQNLVNWALYTDWRLTQRGRQHTLSDIYSDLDLRPRTWLTLNSETRYNTHQGRFLEANHVATVQPAEDWSVSLGHRFRETTPELGLGNNLIMTTFFYRLNENWGMRISHHFEARDGVMERQYYTVYRDFRSWTGGLTFRLRETRVGPDDFTVAFTFSIKAFPRYRVGSDAVRPQLLLGG